MDAFVYQPLRFYLWVFVLGFCTHLLLPALLAFLVPLLLGWFGKGYGVPSLVRHERPSKQFWAGVALTALCCKVLLVGYLLEMRRCPEPSGRFASIYCGPALTYFLGLALSMAVTAACCRVLCCFFYRLRTQRDRPPKASGKAASRPPWWPVGLAASLVGVVYLLLLCVADQTWETQGWLSWLGECVVGLCNSGGAAVSSADYYLIGLTTVSTVVATAFYIGVYFISVYLRWDWFSPVMALGFLLNVVVAVYGFLTFFGLLPVAVFVIMLLVLARGISSYRQRFPALKARCENPLELLPDGSGAKEATAAEPGLLRWEDVPFWTHDLGRHLKNQKRPLVVVCTSGGGLGAAAWTLAVLQQLENAFRAEDLLFPYHIRLVTGASGGMVGASYYTVTLPPPSDAPLSVAEQREQYHRLTQDSLTPVLFQMVYGDLLSALPWPRRYDRGQALEAAWRNNMRPPNSPPGVTTLDVTFGELEKKERVGWLPSLVFSPMLVEDGRRLLVSNLDLAASIENYANQLEATPQLLSREALELFRLFPRVLDTPEGRRTKDMFAVGTAARMSASFPFVSPAVPLPTIPRRRVVDAGYFDNFGVSLAAAWLTENRALIQRYASGVLVLQIRASQREPLGGESATRGPTQYGSTLLSRGLEEL